jgi:hypothetical protein
VRNRIAISTTLLLICLAGSLVAAPLTPSARLAVFTELRAAVDGGDQGTGGSTPSASPEEFLARGQDHYRAGRYTEAVSDLRAAADAFLTPEQMRAYVNTGRFDSLPKFETAVIYLALSYAKLGRNAEASEQIHRLNVAEAIEPIYSKLPLTAEVAEFESIAARVAPAASLPANAALASLRGTTPPPTQVAVVTPAPPAPVVVTTPEATITTTTVATVQPAEPAPTPATTTTTTTTTTAVADANAPRLTVQPTIPEERAAQARIIEERVAIERAALERDAAQRIATAQSAQRSSAQQRSASSRSVRRRSPTRTVALNSRSQKHAPLPRSRQTSASPPSALQSSVRHRSGLHPNALQRSVKRRSASQQRRPRRGATS